jgi:hypothetical protein
LRHTYITRAWVASKDLAATQRLARHKSLTTTQNYINYSAEKLREVNRLACDDGNENVVPNSQASIDPKVLKIAQILTGLQEEGLLEL